MHWAENQRATDGEHSAHCTNKYIGPPTQDDLLDEQQQINSYTNCDKHPTNDYDIIANIPRPLLVAARQGARNLGGTKTFNYYISGYFGSYHHCFVFSANADITLRTPCLADIRCITWEFM